MYPKEAVGQRAYDILSRIRPKRAALFRSKCRGRRVPEDAEIARSRSRMNMGGAAGRKKTREAENLQSSQVQSECYKRGLGTMKLAERAVG